MSEITLANVTGAIVQIVNEAVASGVTLTSGEIHAAVVQRYPGVQEGLLELAFPQAADQLRQEAARASAEADALERRLVPRSIGG
jgi:hypothetical protein